MALEVGKGGKGGAGGAGGAEGDVEGCARDDTERCAEFFRLVRALETGFGKQQLFFEDVGVYALITQLVTMCNHRVHAVPDARGEEEEEEEFTLETYKTWMPEWACGSDPTIQLFDMPVREPVLRFVDFMSHRNIVYACQSLPLYLLTVNLRLRKVEEDGVPKISFRMIQFADWSFAGEGSDLCDFWDAEIGSQILIDKGTRVCGVVCHVASVALDVAQVVGALQSLRDVREEDVHGLIGETALEKRILEYMWKSEPDKSNESLHEEMGDYAEKMHKVFVGHVHRMLLKFDGGFGTLDGRELLHFNMKLNGGCSCGDCCEHEHEHEHEE